MKKGYYKYAPITMMVLKVIRGTGSNTESLVFVEGKTVEKS